MKYSCPEIEKSGYSTEIAHKNIAIKYPMDYNNFSGKVFYPGLSIIDKKGVLI